MRQNLLSPSPGNLGMVVKKHDTDNSPVSYVRLEG